MGPEGHSPYSLPLYFFLSASIAHCLVTMQQQASSPQLKQQGPSTSPNKGQQTLPFPAKRPGEQGAAIQVNSIAELS